MKLLKLIPDNTNINFLRVGGIFYTISAILLVASLALIFTRGFNFGVDFVGGQMIRVTFTESKEAPVASLRQHMDKLGYGDAVIQRFGNPNEVSLRMKLPAGEVQSTGGTETEAAVVAMARKITTSIQKTYPDARIDGVSSVSGKVSGELFQSGMLALGLAMAAIAIYIWVRFEWQFGVGGILALVHDVILTLGLYSLTGLEFDLNAVAALLMLIGYSLNDNIVIYDRIRENMKKYRRMALPDLLNLSVNETLSRTVVTSLTTLISLTALLILGPSVIFGFVAAMTFGIFVGTYSSIYMAAPILIWLGVNSDSFVARESAIDKQQRLAQERG